MLPATRGISRRPYGLRTCDDLFTPRQLVALTTFSDLVQEARERVKHDALAAGLPDDGKPRAPAAPAHRVRGCCGRVSWRSRQTRLTDTGQRSALGIRVQAASVSPAIRSGAKPCDDLGLRRGQFFQRRSRDSLELSIDRRQVPR